MQQRALFKKNGILKECFGKTCFGGCMERVSSVGHRACAQLPREGGRFECDSDHHD